MNEVSVTITAGEGCEEHNHGLEYRSKLEHTHDTNKDTVIELVPYEKSYRILRIFLNCWNCLQKQMKMLRMKEYHLFKTLLMICEYPSDNP